MEREIKNKTIVVTGGANGLGFQIAKIFLKEEAKLAILIDINEEKGKNAVEELESRFGEGKAVFIKCDVVEDLEETFKQILNKYEGVDVLVNSAGITDNYGQKKCIDINLNATIFWSLKFLEHMRKDENGKGGTIINLSSILGYRVLHLGSTYHATKFGVIGFTKCLGHKNNYDETGVRVIAICPGFTKTDITKGILEEELNEDLKMIRDSHQWQSAEDVGDKAVEVFKRADSGTMWEIEGGVLREVILRHQYNIV